MLGVPRLLLLLLAALSGAFAPGEARAQEVIPVRVGTELLSPLSLVKYDDLDFGTAIITGAGDVTITINPDLDGASAVTSTGPTLVNGAQAARFGGLASKNGVNVRLPKADVMVTRVGGSEQLVVRDFTAEGGKHQAVTPGEPYDFKVGGTIDIPDGSIEGLYEGTFTIEVQYP